jgi:hypothetical protein
MADCCPCGVMDCHLCTGLPDTLHATVSGAGPFCSCIPETVVPLTKDPLLCDGPITTGWQGTMELACTNTDTQLVISFCCVFLEGFGYFWLIEIRSLPDGECDRRGISSPGDSCLPLNETHTFSPITGLQCCDPGSGNTDSITVVVTL